MASWADEFDIDDSDILGALNNRRKDPSQLASPPWPPAAAPLPSSPPHQPLASSADPHHSIATSAGLLKRFQKPRPSQKWPSLSQNLGNIPLDPKSKRKQSFDPAPPLPFKAACRQSPSMDNALWRKDPSSAFHAARRETASQLEAELHTESRNQESDEGVFACNSLFVVEERCHSLSSHGFSPTPAIRGTASCYLRNAESHTVIRDQEMMAPLEPLRDNHHNLLSGHGKASIVPPTARQTLKQKADLDKTETGLTRTQEKGCYMTSKRIASASQQEHNLEDMMDQAQPTVSDRPLRIHAPSLQQTSVPNVPSDSCPKENTERSESRCIRSLQKDLHYQIPGPAGTVQRGLGQKTNLTSESNRVRKDNLPRRSSVLDDADFQSGTWLKAKNYIEKFAISVSTISSVKTSRRENRIPKLLAVIKTCIPNGCGDVMVNLRDRSDFISGTVNRRVMSETEYGRIIEPGAVILLHQVAVFSPTPYAHYLNITVNNVEQVFAKAVQVFQGECSRAVTKAVSDMTGDEQRTVDFCAKQASGKNAHLKNSNFLEEDDALEILLAPSAHLRTTQLQVGSELEVPFMNDFMHAGQGQLPTQPNSATLSNST